MKAYRAMFDMCPRCGTVWNTQTQRHICGLRDRIANIIKRSNNVGITTDPKERKGLPIFSGVLAYFPNALLEVARVSVIGNDQHNPGQPLHWAMEKSTDEKDACVRHLMDPEIYDGDGARHRGKAAWRALAALEREILGERAQPNAPKEPDDDLPF